MTRTRADRFPLPFRMEAPQEIEIVTQRKTLLKQFSSYFAMVLLFVISLLIVRYGLVAQISEFMSFIKDLGFLGNIIICLCFFVISFPLILGAYIPLTLGSGAIYGVMIGTLTVSIGSTVGGCAAFWICRVYTKEWLEHALKGRKEFRYFLAVMQGKDSKFVTVLARLSPLPFGLQNGFFALTDISFKDFFLSTWLGLLPYQVIWTHLGTTLRNLSKISSGDVELSLWQQISMVVQVAVTFALVAYFWYMTRKLNIKQEDEMVQESENILKDISIQDSAV
eukprot:TRINITY_DN1665_c0_g1_i1.p1 TRINITY_DN1665_c0_g1~~TRINITY_DN1665_c0_g1_i1.p1  ORF type:complete len:280 (-),score=50.82 TRINITY_DN1665_c0_g1_i1:94-933(-)